MILDSYELFENSLVLFNTIFQNPFLVMDPKNFLKAPLAPIYTNFKGECTPKNRDFLVKMFHKVPTNAFFGLVFPNFACSVENCFGKKQCFGRTRKFNMVDKIFENVLEKRPPSRKS